MKTRGWLLLIMGCALIAFGAYPCLGAQSMGPSVQRRIDVVAVGYNAPGPDSNWVGVPSGKGNTRSAARGGNTDSDSVEVDNGGSATFSSSGAPVTLVEYGDYECPYCQEQVPILHELRHEYGSNLRIVFRDFPLRQHPGAMGAAIAARCAGAQGAFWKYHDALYSGRWGFSRSQFEAIAEYLGLNYGQFANCLDQQRYKGEVEREKANGLRIGVDGTPTYFLNGKRVSSWETLSSFESLIAARLGPDAR